MPERVVSFARSQVLSHLAAVRAGREHPLGDRIVAAFGTPLQDDPARSAYVLSALSMALDFDDTLYAGHVSHSAVAVPLAYARALRLDGRAALAAVLAATESAARITAASTLGRFRGQTASHPHLAGAVVGRLRAEDAPADRMADALTLAFLAPPWTLRPGFLGSSAKVLTAAISVRLGLDACDAAAAGLGGPPDLLERDGGFLEHFCEIALPEAISLGLGERWHTETLTFKCVPASTGVQTAVEAALKLHDRLDGAGADAIEEVIVHANLLTVRASETTLPFLDGPKSSVAALQYALPYIVATALLTGDLKPRDFAQPAVEDAERWRVADRVRAEHDVELTRRAVLATAPIGEALRQAGDRAPEWVIHAGGVEAGDTGEGLGPPAASFEEADKAIAARVEVRLADGRSLSEECIHARGGAGPETRARHPEILREKLLATGAPAEVADVVARIEDASADELAAALEGAIGPR